MAKKILLLFILVLASLTLLIGAHAKAGTKEYAVFDVRKNLPLRDDEPVYKDYYINMGTESGVRPGSIIAVYRRVPVVDVYRNRAQGDLIVPVGHMKVIHTQKTMSVCRLESVANEKQIPVVEFETVMTGDRVQLADGDDEGLQKGPATSKDANSGGEKERAPAAEAAPAPKISEQPVKPQQANPQVNMPTPHEIVAKPAPVKKAVKQAKKQKKLSAAAPEANIRGPASALPGKQSVSTPDSAPVMAAPEKVDTKVSPAQSDNSTENTDADTNEDEAEQS